MNIQSKRIGHRARISRFVTHAIGCFAIAVMPAPGLGAEPTNFDAHLLAAHNAERAQMGVPPLAWSHALATDARLWASFLARSSRFEHATSQRGDKAQGENLWSGSKGAYTPEEMVELWIEEKADYRRGLFPAVSRTGKWVDVGHYTQIIWATTTHLGCALATGSEDDVLVCRYGPAGNIMGDDPQKLLAITVVAQPRKRR
jgi:Cysteine-rich secretory protein family